MCFYRSLDRKATPINSLLYALDSSRPAPLYRSVMNGWSPWPIYRSCNSSSRSINAIQFSPFVKAVPALNCIADQTGGWAAHSTSQRIPNHHSLISWKPLSDTKILHISHLEHYSSLLVYITHVPIVDTSYPALLKKRGLSQSRCG